MPARTRSTVCSTSGGRPVRVGTGLGSSWGGAQAPPAPHNSGVGQVDALGSCAARPSILRRLLNEDPETHGRMKLLGVTRWSAPRSRRHIGTCILPYVKPIEFVGNSLDDLGRSPSVLVVSAAISLIGCSTGPTRATGSRCRRWAAGSGRFGYASKGAPSESSTWRSWPIASTCSIASKANATDD